MNRRQFVALIAGASTWPLGGRAQQVERVRHVAILVTQTPGDAFVQARLEAFRLTLQQLGWTDGRNVRIDVHFGGGDHGRNGGYYGPWLGRRMLGAEVKP